jgi:predicted phage terminase large subunit-like protein
MPRKPGDHPDDWRPHPGPQTRFLSLSCFEALYGGAAGGGKSDCLLVDAIRYVGRGYGTAYQAILLRRTFPELEKSLIVRSQDLYPRVGGRYNQQSKTWTFPGGERVLFGYMENDKDRLQYQGAQFQFVGFDEATHFSAVQYLYLFSRCRSARGVPCRIRGATNPGGPGHEFFFHRFGAWLDKKHPHPAAPGEVRYYLSDPKGGEREVPRGTVRTEHAPDGTPVELPALGRAFVPALLEDNPTLLADPTYQAALAQLDPVTRMQLRYGNWLAATGKKLYFDRQWVTLIDPADVPADLRWARAWDLAATAPSQDNPDPDWTRGVKMARFQGGVLVGDVASLRGHTGAVDAFLQSTARRDGHTTTQVVPLDPGAAGKVAASHYQGLLVGYPVSLARPTLDKLTRFRPFSGYASPPRQGVYVVRAPWNEAYFAELEAFEGRDRDRDDQVDATSDAFNHLAPLMRTVVHDVEADADGYRFAAEPRGY